MKKAIVAVCMAVVLALNSMGCAVMKSAVDGAADGLCWLDRQLPACEWAGEEAAPKNDANDVLLGGGG